MHHFNALSPFYVRLAQFWVGSVEWIVDFHYHPLAWGLGKCHDLERDGGMDEWLIGPFDICRIPDIKR